MKIRVGEKVLKKYALCCLNNENCCLNNYTKQALNHPNSFCTPMENHHRIQPNVANNTVSYKRGLHIYILSVRLGTDYFVQTENFLLNSTKKCIETHEYNKNKLKLRIN